MSKISRFIQLLHQAVADNDADAVGTLLEVEELPESRTALLESKNAKGQTPLHIAAENDYYKVASLLIKAGCDVNAKDEQVGDTALHLAMRNNFAFIANLLTNEKSLVRDAQNNEGNTPLHEVAACYAGGAFSNYTGNFLDASLREYIRVMSPEVLNNEGYSAFHVALKKDSVRFVATFLDAKPELRFQMSTNAEPPLWVALKHDSLETMELLLEKGCDINGKNTRLNASILWLAVYKQSREAIELLLQSEDLDPSAIDLPANDGISTLLLAMIMENNADFNRLLEKIAEHSGGEQLCHVMARKVLFDLASKEDFQKIQAHPSVQTYTDKDGNNLLHLAVLSDSLNMVVAAFVSLPDLARQKNKDALTPVELAMTRSVSSIIHFFQRKDKDKEIFTAYKEKESLVKRFTQFREAVTPDLLLQPHDQGYLPYEQLKKCMLPKVNVPWPKAYQRGDKQRAAPSLPLSKNNYYEQLPEDDYNTVMTKTFLKVLAQIEAYLREEDEVFKHLDVILVPVGSIVEGTKIGQLNEIDTMLFCGALHGSLTVESETTIIISEEKYHLLDGKVQLLFPYRNERHNLNNGKFHTAFLNSIQRAVANIKNAPKKVKFWLDSTQCQHEMCQLKNDEKETFEQWCFQKPPCVCWTAVGAGLNFVWTDGERDSIFTIDVVPSFEVDLNDMSTVTLRQKVINYLINEKPRGWCKFLKKYIRKDRFYLGQHDLEEVGTTVVSLKMVNTIGDFIIRPGLNMNSADMFVNDIVREAYCLLKIFKQITNCSINSFDIKKAVSGTLKNMASSPKNVFSLVKEILDSPDVKSKFLESLKNPLGERYARLDFADFPGEMNGLDIIKLISKPTLTLGLHLINGNIDDFKALLKTKPRNNIIIEGNALLHVAVEMLHLEFAKVLLDNGCDVNLIGLNGNTPLHHALFWPPSSIASRTCNISQSKRMDVIQLLLRDREIMIETQNNNRQTVFHLLATGNFGGEIERLLLDSSTKRGLNLLDAHGCTALFISCYQGNTKLADSLLKYGAEVDKCGTLGYTPLMSACHEGNVDLLSILLSHGANVNRIDTQGMTALMFASQSGQVEAARLLIEKKADVDLRAETGVTALVICSRNGNLKVAKLLVEIGRANINLHAENIWNIPLYRACKNGHLDIVKLLVENKADVNLLRTEKFGTPLSVACWNKHLDIAKFLVDHGANVNLATPKGGRTPLEVTCGLGDWEMVKFLVDHNADVNLEGNVNGTNVTPLIAACARGNLKIAMLLLKRKADANKPSADSAGDTPLHVACASGHLDLVKLLLENQAHVDSKRSNNSLTPLFDACREGHFEIAKLLIENKADVNSMRPLLIACHNKRWDIGKLLIANGADVNLSTPGNGFTPLIFACVQGNLEMANFLVNHHADVNFDIIAGKSALTPLIMACTMGNIEMAAFLLKNKADANKSSGGPEGFTPLHIACANGHLEIAKLLLENNALVDMERIDNGWTPLFEACKAGNLKLADLLLRYGADVNKRKDVTPLILSVFNGYISLVNLLLDHNAEVNQSAKFFPLQVACSKSSLEIVKILIEKGAKVKDEHVRRAQYSNKADIVQYLRKYLWLKECAILIRQFVKSVQRDEA